MNSFSYHGATTEELRAVLCPYLGRFNHGTGGLALVIDADRTLAPEDTGRLVGSEFGLNEEIRSIFETKGYCEQGFVEVSKVWDRLPSRTYLETVARSIRNIHVRKVWIEILTGAATRSPAVVVTSGIPQAWRLALDEHGCSGIPIIGGCHPALDDFLVLPTTKAAVVALLQDAGWKVLAAGDSPIDLDMLKRADLPVFVPDTRGSPTLLKLLPSVPGVRHLVVDEQRFPGLRTLSPAELVAICKGG